MREDICSIPVNEVFRKRGGCPICRMRKILNEHAVDYILGGAMMEPDIRQQTNILGFCKEHYHNMQSRRERLPLALILDTHLEEFKKAVESGNIAIAAGMQSGCFLCDMTERALSAHIATIYKLYENESDFRALFDSGTAFCTEHFLRLYKGGTKKVLHRHHNDFRSSLCRITASGMGKADEELKRFIATFDHQSDASKNDVAASKNAIERALEIL